MLKIKEILGCIVLAFLLIAMISIPEKKKGTEYTFNFFSSKQHEQSFLYRCIFNYYKQCF